MRVLLVDDDPDLLEALADVLLLEGIDVMTAHDGAGCLSAMRSCGPFDLVILDWMMPNVSGADVLTQFERDLTIPRNPIVVLTAFNLSEQDSFGVKVAKKPIRVESLLALVDAHAPGHP
jgi:DNA-binding response OmpR family regulator